MDLKNKICLSSCWHSWSKLQLSINPFWKTYQQNFQKECVFGSKTQQFNFPKCSIEIQLGFDQLTHDSFKRKFKYDKKNTK